MHRFQSGPVTDQYGKQNPISVNLGGIKRTSEGRMVEATVFYNYFTFGSRLDHAETARFLAWLGPAHINDTYWELKVCGSSYSLSARLQEAWR